MQLAGDVCSFALSALLHFLGSSFSILNFSHSSFLLLSFFPSLFHNTLLPSCSTPFHFLSPFSFNFFLQMLCPFSFIFTPLLLPPGPAGITKAAKCRSVLPAADAAAADQQCCPAAEPGCCATGKGVCKFIFKFPFVLLKVFNIQHLLPKNFTKHKNCQ